MKSGGWPSILTIYLFGVLGATTTSEVIPLRTLFDAMADGPRLFTLMLALIGLPATLLSVASGVAVDRVGARRALLLSGAIGACASVGCGVASSPLAFLASRLMAGCSLVGIFTAAPALLMGTTEGNRRIAAMTLWSTYSPVGVSLGFALGGFSAARGSLHVAFVLHGILFAAAFLMGLALPVAAARLVTGRQTIAASIAALGDAYRQPAVAQLALGFLFLISAAYGVSIVLPAYFGLVHGMTAAGAAAIVGGANLTMVPGSFLAGALLARKWSAGAVFASAGAAGLLAGVALFLPATAAGMLFPSLCVWSLCLGAGIAAMLNSLPLVADQARLGSAAGLISQAGAAATLLNPPVWLAALALASWLPFAILLAIGWGGALLLLTRAIRAGGAATGRR